MRDYKIISSDSHILEPGDLWTSRAAPKYRDRVPYIAQAKDNTYRWYVEKDLEVMAIGHFSQAGKRFEAANEITFDGTQEVRRGGYDPDEHVKDMEIDGVDGEILYPSMGILLFKVADSELLTAIFKTYNDWLGEFCSAYPDQLKGIAMVNLEDLQEGIRELERTRKMGLAGAMISLYPTDNRQYDQPEYESFWAAAQDLDMPISLHTGTQRPGTGQIGLGENQTFAFRVNIDTWVRRSLANIIETGVLERYPKLRVGAVEFELSWVPYFLRMVDYVYKERQDHMPYRFKNNLLPSDIFHSNVFVSFQEDDLGIRLRDIIGVDNLMWGSDYPHAESTFPRSQQILDDILAECTQEEKAKISGENAAKLYNFN